MSHVLHVKNSFFLLLALALMTTSCATYMNYNHVDENSAGIKMAQVPLASCDKQMRIVLSYHIVIGRVRFDIIIILLVFGIAPFVKLKSGERYGFVQAQEIELIRCFQ